MLPDHYDADMAAHETADQRYCDESEDDMEEEEVLVKCDGCDNLIPDGDEFCEDCMEYMSDLAVKAGTDKDLDFKGTIRLFKKYVDGSE